MKKYKIKYKRNKRVCLVRTVLTHKGILNALERNKNGFDIIITPDYEFDGEKA